MERSEPTGHQCGHRKLNPHFGSLPGLIGGNWRANFVSSFAIGCKPLTMLPSKPKEHISNMEQAGQAASAVDARERIFWRVEGSLLNLTAVRPVGFFAWNSQTF